MDVTQTAKDRAAVTYHKSGHSNHLTTEEKLRQSQQGNSRKRPFESDKHTLMEKDRPNVKNYLETVVERILVAVDFILTSSLVYRSNRVSQRRITRRLSHPSKPTNPRHWVFSLSLVKYLPYLQSPRRTISRCSWRDLRSTSRASISRLIRLVNLHLKQKIRFNIISIGHRSRDVCRK